MRRWLRCLVCLLVICALLINLSPIRAEATAAGAVGIAKASLVTGNPAIIVGAALLAVGVAAGVESGAFENLVDNAVCYLDSAGSWITDGSMQLLQTVTEAGQTAYYVAGELLETLRSWMISTDVLDISGSTNWNPVLLDSAVGKKLISLAFKHPYFAASSTSDITSSGKYRTTFYLLCSNYPIYVFEDGYETETWGNPFYRRYYYEIVDGVTSSLKYSSASWIPFSGEGHPSAFSSSDINCSTLLDLNLGYVSSVPIDGTSARTWAPDVADRNGLYVKYNNDPDPPDDNNGNWFWRLALPLTILDLIAMSQADEWTGETPEEFPTGSTVTEFEILNRPEIDGYQGIEIAPITQPNPNPNPDPDPEPDIDPTAPGEPNPDPEPDPDPNPDPDPDPNPDPNPDPGTDPGGDGGSGNTTGWKPPSDHTLFALADLSKFFPFCIPFDLYDFFTLLNADPVAPVLSWEIKDLAGQTYSLDVDLSQWDSVALLFRRLQLFLFITGLAAASRKFIKW